MSSGRQRSNSRTRTSRPTTPLRPSSRSSFRDSARASTSGGTDSFPLNVFEPAFAELSDAVADLEANMMHFQLMHESLSRFSESFASFLYGLNMNAFCVDFPEGPIAESYRRPQLTEGEQSAYATRGNDRAVGPEVDSETTFMTTDTSFVENPAPTAMPAAKHKGPDSRPSRVPAPSTRGPSSTRGVRGGRQVAPETQRGRSSGLARARGRGLR
ncbi:hypothetical protein SODALDRAFT_278507 [Sodiomyces alkalinus F11]|uniref:DASH complex subunit DAM1 n=1 Tax=Sodiomyces alkalinus (strain CBS 110278 / VKM F-3762 / F11) TaxID=1314773 RepID=A0A3N2PTS3_SODAK|nr:hypothetical protein SODALDRAFT_278507 [Sodiomyces alkalinus F11]ROT37909.1 hypothetical protein SODALDRAFT_278507 [Sodiomyces alkalinus F11]